jgi:hypothetical protein
MKWYNIINIVKPGAIVDTAAEPKARRGQYTTIEVQE